MVYVKPARGWTSGTETVVLYIDPSYYPKFGVGFGFSVGVSDNAVVVGATGCCFNGEPREGQAYVFVEPPSGWATTSNYNAELTGTNVGSADDFGIAVAIDGNTIVVGSPQDDSNGVGGVYVYVEPVAGWSNMTETAELYPLATLQGWFGQSVAIRGNEVFIGAPQTPVDEVSGRGTAYVFVEPKNGWQSTSAYTAKLARNSGYYFGQSVSISGTNAVAGYSGTYNTNGGTNVMWVK